MSYILTSNVARIITTIYDSIEFHRAIGQKMNIFDANVLQFESSVIVESLKYSHGPFCGRLVHVVLP